MLICLVVSHSTVFGLDKECTVITQAVSNGITMTLKQSKKNTRDLLSLKMKRTVNTRHKYRSIKNYTPPKILCFHQLHPPVLHLSMSSIWETCSILLVLRLDIVLN